MAVMARLNRIWWCDTISFKSKFKLYKPLVTSILLYGCETWTLLANSEKKDPGFKTKCVRKLLCISYLEHKTNDWVQSKINFLVGLQEPLPATVKRQKLAWFRHVTRHNRLSKTILQGTFKGGDAVVGSGNAGWTESNSEHPCPFQNSSQWPPALKTRR